MQELQQARDHSAPRRMCARFMFPLQEAIATLIQATFQLYAYPKFISIKYLKALKKHVQSCPRSASNCSTDLVLDCNTDDAPGHSSDDPAVIGKATEVGGAADSCGEVSSKASSTVTPESMESTPSQGDITPYVEKSTRRKSYSVPPPRKEPQSQFQYSGDSSDDDDQFQFQYTGDSSDDDDQFQFQYSSSSSSSCSSSSSDWVPDVQVLDQELQNDLIRKTPELFDFSGLKELLEDVPLPEEERDSSGP
ncbi:hypothetical protein RUND412_008539 [Rhizina undulata]